MRSNPPDMLAACCPRRLRPRTTTPGEPFRIVADPPVPIPGETVAERRARAIGDPAVQGLRAVLCSEPRGHADMYGGFIVPPDDDGADLGVLFWHKDGFSTACGHGTIALGVWAVETGRVAAPHTGSVDVAIDVPSGRVTARVHREDARVIAVDFVNVPRWVVASDVPVTTSRGKVRVTVLATVDADGRRAPRGTDREHLPAGPGPRGLHRARTPPHPRQDRPQALVVLPASG